MSKWKTFEELKAWVERKRREVGGVKCPCCGQLSKVYQRSISASMVKTLKYFYIEGPENFHHYSKVSKGSDYIVLSYFGLIESGENLDRGKKASGFWRITKTGINFLFYDLKIPQYVLVYNKECLGTAGPFIGVRDCVGSFSFPDIMAGVVPPKNIETGQTSLFPGGE